MWICLISGIVWCCRANISSLHLFISTARLVVAPVGSVILDETGEEVAVKSTTVGGVMSEGMFCDSSMLGWTGGAVGVAAQMPESFEVGSAPPAQKPRLDPSKTEDARAGAFSEGLFERKPTKEEKKRIAEERRNARKAAKEAKK